MSAYEADSSLADKQLLYAHLPDNDELYEGLQCIMRKLKVALEQGYPYTYQYFQQQKAHAGPNKAKLTEQASDEDMKFVYQRQLDNMQQRHKEATIRQTSEKVNQEKDASRAAEISAEIEILTTTINELKDKIASHSNTDQKESAVGDLNDPTWWRELRRECDLILNTNETEFEKGAAEDYEDDEEEDEDGSGDDLSGGADDDGGVDEEVLSLDDDRKRVRRRQSVSRHQQRLKGLKHQVKIILQEIADRQALRDEIAALHASA